MDCKLSFKLTLCEELVKAAVLNCDLSSIPLGDFDRYQNQQTRRPFYIAYLMCKVVLSGTCLEVSIQFKGKEICTTRIDNVQNASAASPRGQYTTQPLS